MRSKLIPIGIVLMVFFGFMTAGVAQEATITVESWSPQELHDAGLDSRPSPGLSVVGRGEQVYLFATSDSAATAYSWSIMTAPMGSMATLDSTDTQRTTFSPDSVGTYEIGVSIMTTSGPADTSVTITSATYRGSAACAGCHPIATPGWAETGHASMFTNRIDLTSFYSESCIECHTVGFDTLATNGGFDDVADANGWTFPDTIQPGNWDDMVANFPAVAGLANIQCENCHGPGSEHASTLDPTKIAVTLNEGACGRCHNEEPRHIKNIQWEQSGHANPATDRSNSGSCARCHSAYGFVNFIDPVVDKGHKVTLGLNQTTCAACHDPHKVDESMNPMQLRNVDNVTLGNGVVVTDGGRGRFCGSCHISRRNAETYVEEYHGHFGPHHSNQLDMLAASNAIDFGKEIPSGSHITAVEDGCIGCHMAATPEEGQLGHNTMGEHTFAMHSEVDGVDNVSACLPCHVVTSFDDFEADFDYDADGTVETMRGEIQGLLDDVGLLLPPFGDTEVVVDTSVFPLETYTPMILKAAYNYEFVVDDGSMGMHNFAFAANLLAVTRDTLRMATSVEPILDPLAGVPGSFDLHQNYPNPFNPTTKIRFDVPTKSHVRLSVYNSLGQKVETLVDDEYAANSYEVDFNASSLPSGIYFYRVEADNFVSVKKMLLLK